MWTEVVINSRDLQDVHIWFCKPLQDTACVPRSEQSQEPQGNSPASCETTYICTFPLFTIWGYILHIDNGPNTELIVPFKKGKKSSKTNKKFKKTRDGTKTYSVLPSLKAGVLGSFSDQNLYTPVGQLVVPISATEEDLSALSRAPHPSCGAGGLLGRPRLCLSSPFPRHSQSRVPQSILKTDDSIWMESIWCLNLGKQ